VTKLPAILRKELLVLLRDPVGLAVIFLMPLAVLLVVTLVQDGAFKKVSSFSVKVALVDEDQSDASRLLAQGLGKSNGILLQTEIDGELLQRGKASKLVRDGDAQVFVVFPKGLGEASVDAAAAAGQVIVQGSIAATETGTDTILANGSSQIITTGYASATEAADDTLQSTGSVLVQGLLDAAEAGGDTAYLAGQIYVIGAAAATESGADTFAAIGSGAGVAYWPTPDQVLAGVSYGPTGADYTGTATAGSYPTAADIAAAVLATLQATIIPVNLTQIKGQTLNGSGSSFDPWGPA